MNYSRKMAVWSSAVACVAWLASAAGQASSGFDCVIEDANLSLAAGGYGPRSIPSAVMGFGGTAQLKVGWTAEELKTIPLDKHLMQSWWEGGELRLLIYRETEGSAPFASVKLVLVTKMTDDEAGYAGTYELTVGNSDPAVDKTETFTGKVACGAE